MQALSAQQQADFDKGYRMGLEGIIPDSNRKWIGEGWRKGRTERVETLLGGGVVICERCKATLANYADACTAALDDRCPGFEAIEAVACKRSPDPS